MMNGMQPTSARERYPSLDILRGLALFGVLLVNLLTLFRISLFAHITGSDAPTGAAGHVVMTLVRALIEFKAFTLFSFLFGVGVAVQSERAGQFPARFLLRRFLVLLVIGVVHLVLIWNGDILTLYAVCGLLMLPLLRLPDALLVSAASVLVITSYSIPSLMPIPAAEAMRTQAELATRVYSQGGFTEILVLRWDETRSFLLPLLVATLPRTLGVMLLGAAAWRMGWMIGKQRLWICVLWAGGVTGIPAMLLHIELATVPLALAYAAAVLLWIPRAAWIAAAGQMALTNYLLQSVVFSLAFYGFGLGLFGRVGPVEATVGGAAFYGAQIALSRWWLSRFHFGPVEWLWRTLSYGQRQPMQRERITLSQGVRGC